MGLCDTAPISAPSIGSLIWLSCGVHKPQLSYHSFTLVTYPGNLPTSLSHHLDNYLLKWAIIIGKFGQNVCGYNVSRQTGIQWKRVSIPTHHPSCMVHLWVLVHSDPNGCSKLVMYLPDWWWLRLLQQGEWKRRQGHRPIIFPTMVTGAETCSLQQLL